MHRDSLLSHITKMKEPVYQLIYARHEFRRLSSPIFNFGNLPRLLKIGLGVLLYLYLYDLLEKPVGNTIAFIFGIKSTISGLLAIGYLFLLIVGTTALYAAIEHYLNLIQIKFCTKLYQEQLKQLRLAETTLLSELSQQTIVPSYYWFPDAIESFETYLINYRADTIKEAINIYEEERRHLQFVDELKNIQEIQDMILSEVKDIKWATLWSA